MVGIYKIENLVNGKVYIGQSTNIKERWNYHRNHLDRRTHENQHLTYAWHKYGEANFNFSILEECDVAELEEKEIYWIKHYKQITDVYNMDEGGFGYANGAPVLQFNYKGALLNEYETTIKAAGLLNVDASNIYRCCIGQTKTCQESIFLYKKDYDNNPLILQERLELIDPYYRLSVEQYEKDGKFIKEWDSLKSIKITLGWNVKKVCEHKQFMSHDFFFKYKPDITGEVESFLEWFKKHCVETNMRPIYQVNDHGEIVNTYMRLMDAEKNGFMHSKVKSCLNHESNSYNNYVWIYMDEYNNYSSDDYYNLIHDKKRKLHFYKIIQEDFSGKKINVYNSLQDVSKNGFNRESVADCCLGKRDSYKGFKWEYGEKAGSSQAKAVIQMTDNYEFVNKYLSVVQAANYTGINKYKIYKACASKQEFVIDGNIFIYESEYMGEKELR